jgi:DnaJ-class molecular chaperone
MKAMRCAFCRGEGSDPFDLLSPLARCQVCGGKGMVVVEEPVAKCIYCRGSGVQPYGTRITCQVCGGKGVVAFGGSGETCPHCQGSGRTAVNGLPCTHCRGRGTISHRAPLAV